MVLARPRSVGQPRKWESPEQLAGQIDGYFKDLVDEEWQEVLVPCDGNDVQVMKWVPVLDRHGKVKLKYKEKPSITGLAVYLDTNRETLMRYTKDSRYYDTIRRAKSLIEKYYENEMEEAPQVKIFKLKNFNWTDTQEIKATQTITQTNIVAPVDLDDRIKSIVQSKLDALK